MSYLKRIYIAVVVVLALGMLPLNSVSAPAHAASHESGYAFVPAGIEQTVSLFCDGRITTVAISGGTVADLLKRQGIALGEYDRVTPVPTTALRGDMVISVHRARFTTETLFEIKPREVERIANEYLPVGTEKVITEGADGTRTATYTTVMVNGQQTARVMDYEVVEVAPVTRVVEYGPGGTIVTDDGRELKWSHKIDASATAYTTEGYTSKTNALGRVARTGTVAVDPKLIPMLSTLYIESRDGGASWTYGEAVAEDTGGVIKGAKVDLYFDTRAECFSFGRRYCTVYVLVGEDVAQ